MDPSLSACNLSGCVGVDVSTKLTGAMARALAASIIDGQPVRFVWRYVFFGPARARDLDRDELDAILASGLAALIVQHPRLPKVNVLSHTTGQSDAEWAVRNALVAGYAPSSTLGGSPALALDMEGVQNAAGGGPVAHAAAWCAYVRAAGFQPVVYVGYQSGLTAADLDALPGDPLFWCDLAPESTRPHPSKGWAGKQSPQTTVAGIPVDPDRIMGDVLGVVAYVAQGGEIALEAPTGATEEDVEEGQS